MKLILSGGGDQEDSSPLDREFATWIGQERFLYLPFASRDRGDGYAGHLAWLRSVFEPLGLSNPVMWTSFYGRTAKDLAGFAGVYIGGGNTFKLLQLLKQTRFDRLLLDYLKNGGAVYGGSAGAIVLGQDIASCAHDDPNDVRLADTTGLNLLNGHDVWCHYTTDQARSVQEYCNRTHRPVYALTERSGLKITENGIQSIGLEAHVTFTPSL
ncbi:peptidase E [Deinococcus cavernae]|uniref:Peptidase E n=1 Tax=Deinococcus cavernae TaxID=2320857 RepID=A0A418V696_9DEIO|nr:Type 1 glutamine amidotransferase-like domain-containing protein [Deinococcus cavernae]RJF71606.1 peptidase E [Deinococcus cavernae]